LQLFSTKVIISIIINNIIIIIIIIIIKYICIVQGHAMLQMCGVDSYMLKSNVLSLFLNTGD